MTTFRSLAILGALALALHGQAAVAQSASTPAPRPGLDYDVRGWFDGQEMPPWESTLLVADTTLIGSPATLAVYRSRFVEGRWLFEDTAVWNQAGAMRARMVGRGRRGDSWCELSAKEGTVTGSTHQAPALEPRKVEGLAIPAFALAAYLSTLDLSANDTVRVSVVRCSAQFGRNAIEVVPFAGIVRAATVSAAAGNAAETVWEIEGTGAYAAAATITTRYREVLRFTTPHGTVGHSVDSIRP